MSLPRRFLLTRADWITAGLVALSLPSYYKLKFILDGELSWRNFLYAESWVEYLFSSLLGLGLVFANRITRRRGRIQFAATAIASAIAALAFTWFYYSIVFPFGAQESFLFDVAVLALLAPLLITGVRDRIVLSERVEAVKLRAVEAEKEALAARYETLKARLSPHFLFNGLNTLADIVEQDPALATRFIDSLAAVYRYLIEQQDAERAPLKDELEAVRSLLFVLQTRHPDALQITLPRAITIADTQIVPLTLQTLLENALKHNAYSKAAPLQIAVTIEDDEILVENSLNPKRDAVSLKTGLENLHSRTLHATGRPLAFGERSGVFWARAPLMKAGVR